MKERSIERRGAGAGGSAARAQGPQRDGHIAHSPAMLAQRQRIGRGFGNAVQLSDLDQQDARKQSTSGPGAAGRFLVDAGESVGEGQLDKDEFLSRMQAQVLAASKEILGPLGMAQDDCPDLKYWVSHYRGKDAAHFEQVIARYAPGTQAAQDWSDYLSLLVERVRERLAEHALTGAGLDPEPVPASVEEQRPAFPAAGVQLKAAPVAQLNCFGSSSSKEHHDGRGRDDRDDRKIDAKKIEVKEKAPAKKFTKADVFKATEPSTSGSPTLADMLGGQGKQFSPEGLEDIFGIRKDAEHLRMNSILATNDFAFHSVEEGRVEFSNLFSPHGWVMAENFKDANLAEDDIYMSDVVAYQWQRSGIQDDDDGLKYLARKHIISKNGKAFFEKYQFEDNTDMSPDQLEEFLTQTPNGKSSVRILREHDERLEVASARVLNRDGHYSVVLKLRRK